ncbi:MAG: FIVAR domain-containing protein [Clostridiales bacterium]|nr:FIVAR domain-containing protein [Clostridiales bacterium]
MNTNVRKKIRGVKLAALLLTAALVLAAIIPQIGTTLAAAGDINVVLECESGIGEALTVEVGQAKVRTVSGLIDAESGDASVIKVEATPSLFFNNLRAIGVKAGVASIGYGNNLGSVTVLTYQVTDSDNVSAYRISNGGEVYFTSPGHTKASPVNVTAGRFDRINWGVMNENVATVAADGAITATGYGVTVIIGSFADKWGVDRNLHLLVGVGVKIGLSDLGDLIDLLTEAERILAEDPSPYTEKELAALQEAVDNIKDMLNTGTPTEQEILDAIKELETIIENLGKGLPDGVVEGEDGNYYKGVDENDGVFVVVDKDGEPATEPPGYVWAGPDGVPGTEDDRPAVEVDGNFYVEEPEGGNIWREIDENGNLKDKPLVWGGPDGVLGTEDDRPVVEVDGGLYVEEPQGGNVWREIDENGNLKDNPVIWGGPDGILGTGDDRIAVEVDGGLYVEEPEGGNIWREIDENGNLKDKPVIWGGPDGILGTDDDRIAVEVDGGLYVEDPQGSNIWREIGANGKLKDAPLIWAGPDGKLGGGNDEIVEFFDGEYWAHKGQNVWRQVDLANPTAPLGALTGGGPTKNPAQHGVVPIFDNTKKDGKYYIGPLGFDDCLFYYGDGPDGNGLLDSTTEEPIGDDIVYLMDKDGNMVTAPTGVVIGLVISPANAKVPRGGTQQFTAMALTGDGFLIEATNVVWGISTPGHKSSIHTLNGLLTVGANEYLKTLEITASLFSAGSVKGTTIVNIAGWNV